MAVTQAGCYRQRGALQIHFEAKSRPVEFDPHVVARAGAVVAEELKHAAAVPNDRHGPASHDLVAVQVRQTVS